LDTLTSLRVFREVVDLGSFVAAATRLGLSTAMTSKHVAHLERRLGVRLLNRSSRHQSLTEAGRVYHEQCREALEILHSAEAAIGQQAEAPRGVLKATAPAWLATQSFAGLLVAYKRQYPLVVVDMRLENRRVDLVEEGYDLALRATQEPSPTLIVRPLCKVEFKLVAAPAYLQARGRPRTPRDVESHQLLLPTYVDLTTMEIKGPDGSKTVVHHQAAFRCNDSTLSLHAARAGMGLVYLPAWLVDDDIQNGALESLLPDCSLLAPTLYAAYTSRKYMAPKVRSFIDFISGALGEASVSQT
jgi:DNA-binding transcriptional LysR family regulator